MQTFSFHCSNALLWVLIAAKVSVIVVRNKIGPDSILKWIKKTFYLYWRVNKWHSQLISQYTFFRMTMIERRNNETFSLRTVRVCINQTVNPVISETICQNRIHQQRTAVSRITNLFDVTDEVAEVILCNSCSL